MHTYLFVTKPKYKPEGVEAGRHTWWSCSSTTRIGDRALIYVTGVGVRYEWRVLSNAKSNKEWRYTCDVEHVQTLDPPISIGEIRDTFSRKEWAPPYLNFWGIKSITVADSVAERIRGLRAQSVEFDHDLTLPEEVCFDSSLLEGTVRQISVNAYERNPVARKRCIAHYGPTCTACGFNFGDVYGHLADGFIHVHHVKELSQIGQEYEVDPIADLRPVCPNCHAIIHLHGACRTIDEVKRLLRAARQARRRTR